MKSGGPDLRPEVLLHSSFVHRCRSDVAAPLLSVVFTLDGGMKSSGPGLRPDDLQHSSFVHRRCTDVAAPVLPSVLTLDGVAKSGGLCRRTFCPTRHY